MIHTQLFHFMYCKCRTERFDQRNARKFKIIFHHLWCKWQMTISMLKCSLFNFVSREIYANFPFVWQMWHCSRQDASFNVNGVRFVWCVKEVLTIMQKRNYLLFALHWSPITLSISSHGCIKLFKILTRKKCIEGQLVTVNTR